MSGIAAGFGQFIQPILNILNTLLDISAQTVDDRLVFVFPFLVLGKHAKKQVDIQRRPDALLQRKFKNIG